MLVEDPLTGEERWMLEPKKESKGPENWLEQRRRIAAIDVFCGVMLLVSIVFSVAYGRPSPKTLGGVVFMRALML